MKGLLVLLLVGAINLTYGGILPASTTVLRSSSTIAYPSPSLVYSQQHAPLALSYSAPLAYSHAVAPAVYSQQILAPSAHYIRPLYTHGSVLAQQSIIQQYPGLIAQNPVVGHYPVSQAPVVGQYPGIVQEPSQIPIQGGTITDIPQIAAPLPPAPSPPQQSPILSGDSAGATFDDDTVSVESA